MIVSYIKKLDLSMSLVQTLNNNAHNFYYIGLILFCRGENNNITRIIATIININKILHIFTYFHMNCLI